MLTIYNYYCIKVIMIGLKSDLYSKYNIKLHKNVSKWMLVYQFVAILIIT